MIEELTFRRQTPTPPMDWLYHNEPDGNRIFKKEVYLGKNAEPWPECTDEQKSIYEKVLNQRPTPPNEWLYMQSFVPNPETGEPEEVRSNWCTQHMGEIPDDAPVTDWPKYLYHECTDQQRRDWEEQHPDPEPEPSDDPADPAEPAEPANEGKEAEV